MEWIQRNPKKTVGLSALAVVVVVMLVWGMTGGSDSPEKSTLGGPPLATPTATPTHQLTVLPSASASAVPTSIDEVIQGLQGGGNGAFTSGFGQGSSKSLPSHHVVVTAGSDGPMMGVGWWIPFADGARKGGKKGPGPKFVHADHTYGDSDLARILAYGGPTSRKTWCTVTVDGKVTERQQAKGPYAEVFCQG